MHKTGLQELMCCPKSVSTQNISTEYSHKHRTTYAGVFQA